MNAQAATSTFNRPANRVYNAAQDLLGRNLAAGRGNKVAYIDDGGRHTYDDLARRIHRCANALAGLGIQREQRVLLALLDTIDFPAAFLGAIEAGIVPVAANTLLTTADYDYMLRDSRAVALLVSEALLPAFAPLLGTLPDLRHVIVSGQDAHGNTLLSGLLATSADRFETVPTCADETCFWLYSSGSTGAPKGTVHVHPSLERPAEL